MQRRFRGDRRHLGRGSRLSAPSSPPPGSRTTGPWTHSPSPFCCSGRPRCPYGGELRWSCSRWQQRRLRRIWRSVMRGARCSCRWPSPSCSPAAAGKRWQTCAVAGACAAVLVAVSLPAGDDASLIRAFAGTSWLGILVLFGEGARLRGERVANAADNAKPGRGPRDEYRLALARDIHDVVAHSLSLINVRASVALHLGEKDPEQFRPALEAIKTASKESPGRDPPASGGPPRRRARGQPRWARPGWTLPGWTLPRSARCRRHSCSASPGSRKAPATPVWRWC